MARKGLVLAAIQLAGLIGIAGAQRAGAQTIEAVDDFGRWEKPLTSCRMTLGLENPSAEGRSCRSLRLDQPMGGLLRVNFISADRESRFASRELIFVGLLGPGSRPMRCRHGRCEPSWPIRLEVRALALSERDGNGVARALPRGHLARGQCLLAARRIECRAVGRNGDTWQADGRF